MNRLRYVLVFLWGCAAAPATAPASDAPPPRFATFYDPDGAHITLVRDALTAKCYAVYVEPYKAAPLGEVPCGP